MKLKRPAPATFLRKILKHFCVIDRGIDDVSLKEFAKFVVDDIETSIALGLEAFCHTLIEFNHVKSKKWIKNTSSRKRRINLFKSSIGGNIIVFQPIYKYFHRIVDPVQKLFKGFRKILLPTFDYADSSFIVGLWHGIQKIMLRKRPLQR